MNCDPDNDGVYDGHPSCCKAIHSRVSCAFSIYALLTSDLVFFFRHRYKTLPRCLFAYWLQELQEILHFVRVASRLS